MKVGQQRCDIFFEGIHLIDNIITEKFNFNCLFDCQSFILANNIPKIIFQIQKQGSYYSESDCF